MTKIIGEWRASCSGPFPRHAKCHSPAIASTCGKSRSFDRSGTKNVDKGKQHTSPTFSLDKKVRGRLTENGIALRDKNLKSNKMAKFRWRRFDTVQLDRMRWPSTSISLRSLKTVSVTRICHRLMLQIMSDYLYIATDPHKLQEIFMLRWDPESSFSKCVSTYRCLQKHL